VASERREVTAVVDDDRHEAMDRLLSSWCAECGDELNLTPSGHYFCANRRCKDGFDVAPKRKLKKLVNVNSQLKDKRH
jgi:hypothetical protein